MSSHLHSNLDKHRHRCDSSKTTKTSRNPRNVDSSFFVNFAHGKFVNDEVVRRTFEKFGAVRSVVMCSVDSCQAFVTMYEESALLGYPNSVDVIFRSTKGFMIVHGYVWTLERVTKDNGSESVCSAKSRYRSNSRPKSRNNCYDCYNSSPDRNAYRESSSASSSNNSSVSQFSSGRYRSGFLPLAPPYHILPDTPYFRRARIVPPPSDDFAFNMPALQRIINRYLASMYIADQSQYEQSYPSAEYSMNFSDFTGDQEQDELTITEDSNFLDLTSFW